MKVKAKHKAKEIAKWLYDLPRSAESQDLPETLPAGSLKDL